MEKGKRQSRKTAQQKRASHLIDVVEIKQETDIKEEPQPIGDLPTVSTRSLDNRGDKQLLADQMESDDDEEGQANCPFESDHDIKIEVKDECDETRKKAHGPESSDDNEHDASGQPNDQPSNAHSHNAEPNKSGESARSKKVKANRFSLKQHQCTQCEYAAMYKSALDRHMLKHTEKKPFGCKHCAKAFTDKQNLQDHMKVHVKNFFFTCSVCLRGFDRKNERAEHEDNCKALRYECHLCKKSFGIRKTDLIIHMRVHSGEKAFECEECFQRFARKSSLNSHMKVHAGPRSFRCSKCLQLFAQQNECNKHEQKCNRRTFECYACGRKFGMKKANLDQHMLTHTGIKPFACNQCSKRFNHKRSLHKHLAIHTRSLPWKCNICRKGFAKQTQCMAHQRSCQQRGYECCFCKKFFGSQLPNLKEHTRTHTGEKPLKCEICQNRFNHKSALTRHINSIHNKQL